jgi:dethiobiotin synthetase
MQYEKVYFVSGIDTDAGKSYATGFIAAEWRKSGVNAITQKLIQTGSTGLSEDIETHRRIMGTGLLPEDLDNTTCPLRFSYPASPDLAARIDNRTIDLSICDESTDKLLERYDTVLIEGAGGLMVPIDGFYTMADYAAERNLPLILVTNPKLGSVNHTLLSLELCINRGIRVAILAYNLYNATSDEITEDTRNFLKKYLTERLPDCLFMEIPVI